MNEVWTCLIPNLGDSKDWQPNVCNHLLPNLRMHHWTTPPESGLGFYYIEAHCDKCGIEVHIYAAGINNQPITFEKKPWCLVGKDSEHPRYMR